MQIISTNIGKPQLIDWRGKKVKTGIFKYPVDTPIFLGEEHVKDDHVIDRKYHGGKDKACYLFSEIQHKYWKELYPSLDWNWGMFGENLTVSNLDESEINIGDTYQLGKAIVQVTQPRQPCFKLGVRFRSQKMIQQFIEHKHAGVYVRVLKEGEVKKDDSFSLLEKNESALSIKNIFKLLYDNTLPKSLFEKAVEDPLLAESCRRDLQKRWRITE